MADNINWSLAMPQQIDIPGAFAAGYLVPFEAQNIKQQTELRKMQVQQEKQKQDALRQYQQTGDPRALAGVNPQLQMQIQNYLDTRPPEELRKLSQVTQYMQMARPYVNPQNWSVVRQNAIQMGAPENMLPPENATPQELNKMFWGADMFAAALKQGPKAIQPGGALVGPRGEELYKAPPTALQTAQTELIKRKTEDPGFGKELGAHMKRYQNETTGEVATLNITDPRLNDPKWKEFKGDELDLSPEAIDMMAERYAIDGTMPGLGLGKAATKARSAVMNRLAEKVIAGEYSVSDMVGNKNMIAGLRSETSRLLGQRGPMLAFAKTADKNLDIALDLSEKVGRTGVPVLNRWINAGRQSVAGDPDVAAFHAATQVAINEFAKVTSSATGGGVTSDTARKEIESVLNTAFTPEQFKSVVKTLRSDMSNRVSGYDESLKRIQDATKLVGGKDSAAGKLEKPGDVTFTPQEQKAVDIAKSNPEAKKDLKRDFPELYKKAFPKD